VNIAHTALTLLYSPRVQRLLSLEPSANKFAEMARLAHDFVFAAETYGKVCTLSLI
jgi:hypothetical protein